MGSLFFSINGWVFKVKSCLANNSVQFSGHQVKILNLKKKKNIITSKNILIYNCCFDTCKQ